METPPTFARCWNCGGEDFIPAITPPEGWDVWSVARLDATGSVIEVAVVEPSVCSECGTMNPLILPAKYVITSKV